MSNGGLTLYLDGLPAETLGYGAVRIDSIEHVYSPAGSGLHQVTFDLAQQKWSSIPQARQGALVEVRRGPITLGTAVLGDINPGGEGLVADGLYRRAERFPPLRDVLGVPTLSTNPRAVVAYANTLGLRWGNPANLPDVELNNSATGNLTTLAGLLNAWAVTQGKVWGLDANNVPYLSDRPATVTHVLRPSVPAMPTADDDYANHVALRYARQMSTPTDPDDSPVPTAWAVVTADAASATNGDRWYFEDITDLGLLAATSSDARDVAQAIADRMVAERAARPPFASGVKVGPLEVETLGMTPPSLWVPLHGRRVRQLGVLTDRATPNLPGALEWIVGRSVYRPADGRRELVPTEIADRSLSRAFRYADDAAKPITNGREIYVGMAAE